MAKGNMLLGYSRGKVGDLVFKRVNGKQVTVPRVRVISNPKTDAQSINRLAFATASKTAQSLRGIVDHSFQGLKYGSTSVNHFVSLLSKEIGAQMQLALSSPTSASPFGCAPVLPFAASGVASGALALVSNGDLDGYNYGVGAAYRGVIMAQNTGAVSATTKLSDWERIFGVPYTDQTTIIVGIVRELDYISESQLFYGLDYEWLRFNFRADVDPTTTAAYIEQSGVLVLNPAAIDSERTDARALTMDWRVDESGYIVVGKSFDDNTDAYEYDIFDRPADHIATAAVIVSRFEGNVWRRSTSRLAQTPKQRTSFVVYTEDLGYNDVEEVLALARPSENVREDEYLNKKKA